MVGENSKIKELEEKIVEIEQKINEERESQNSKFSHLSSDYFLLKKKYSQITSFIYFSWIVIGIMIIYLSYKSFEFSWLNYFKKDLLKVDH